MAFYGSVFLTLLVLTTHHVCATSGFDDDANFESYECYRDLCVSRRQFCSASEQRCKECLPAHCSDPNTTPERCRPLCPHLLNPVTERPTTTAGVVPPGHPTAKDTTGFVSTRSAAQKDGFVSSRIFQVTVLCVLMVVLALLVIILACVYKLHGRHPLYTYLPPSTRGRGGVLGTAEEGQALMGEGWGSKSSNRTVGGISQSTSSSPSSQPPKREPTPPSGTIHLTRQDSKGVQTEPSPQHHLHPPYTARTHSQLCLFGERSDAVVQPAAGDSASTADSLRHFKGYEYRLLPTAAAAALKEHVNEPPPPVPPHSSPASVSCIVTPGAGQDPLMQNAEETYPKSL